MRNDSEARVIAGVTIDRKLVVTVVLLAAGIVLAVNAPSMMPNAYVLSAAIVIVNYARARDVVELHGRLHRLHLARSRVVLRTRRLWHSTAGHPRRPAELRRLGRLGLLVAVLAVPIGFASLRVRGASFVIASIALVLILLLVFQSWSSVTGGSNGLVVPRPFPDLLRPDHHYRFFYFYLALLAGALLVWWVIDRSRFGMGLKAIREDEDKAQALGVPTFAYKLIAFVVSAFFTALGGGMYALWFGDLDPVFQFSILIGAYMVLMSLLGGVRSLFGPLLGALVVGFALEYFKLNLGDSQAHLVATGLLLAVVVLFMPDGVIPAATALVKRIRGGGRPPSAR